MANLKVLIESVDDVELVQDLIDRQQPASGEDMPDFMSDYLQVLQSGLKPGSVMRFSACDDSAAVEAELDTVIEDNTITIGIVELTAKDEPATEDEFAVGEDDEETAANLAACINAHSSLSTFLKASSVDETVTITCLVAGSIGNQIAVEADNTITLSADHLEDGTDANNITEEM